MFQDSTFARTFVNTMIYGFGCSILDVGLGLGLALFLNQRFPGHNIVRTIIYLPVLISGLVGYIMYFIFQYSHGALSDILAAFGSMRSLWP